MARILFARQALKVAQQYAMDARIEVYFKTIQRLLEKPQLIAAIAGSPGLIKLRIFERGLYPCF